MRTRIKICGLTREADVDAAVMAGADAIGFVLYDKSARYVGPARAAELARRLPPFVTRCRRRCCSSTATRARRSAKHRPGPTCVLRAWRAASIC